jgi:hypothetical protein
MATATKPVSEEEKVCFFLFLKKPTIFASSFVDQTLLELPRMSDLQIYLLVF